MAWPHGQESSGESSPENEQVVAPRAEFPRSVKAGRGIIAKTVSEMQLFFRGANLFR